MTEACPVCDTLWRLYSVAAENHHTLVGKHAEARGAGTGKTAEILDHEIAIAESAFRAVRQELRRHDKARHSDRQNRRKPQDDHRSEKRSSTASWRFATGAAGCDDSSSPRNDTA